MGMEKIIRKITSLILTFSVCASVCGVNTVHAANTPESKSEENVNLVKALGLVELGRYGEYNAEEYMSRLEFAGVLAKVFNITEYKDEQLFKDVPLGTKNAGYIGRAYQLGIFSGDGSGNFRPYDTITYVEAVKSIAYAAGYGEEINYSGGTASAVLNSSAANVLSKGGGFSQNQKMRREDIAQILVNAFDLQVVYTSGGTISDGVWYGDLTKDKDTTVLSYFMNMRKVKGIVTGNEYTSIYNNLGAPCAEDQLQIEGEIYEYADGEDLIGMYVTAYVSNDEDSENEIRYITTYGKNNTLTLKHGDFSYTNGTLYNDEGSRSKRIRLSDSVCVIYNENYAGRIGAGNIMDDIFDISSGNILLIDNNDDNAYEICRITEYDIAYIKEADVEQGVFVDVYTQEKIQLDESQCKIEYYYNDKLATINKITDNSVLSIVKSPDGKLCRVYITDSGVNGSISKINSSDGVDYVTINGKEYTVSRYYSDLQNSENRIIVPLNINLSGKFIFSYDGEIVAYINTSETNYAYVISTWCDENEEKAGIKMYTENGKIERLELAKKTNVTENGQKKNYTAVQAVSLISSDSVIRYKLDDNKAISDIDVAVFDEKGNNTIFTKNTDKVSLTCSANVLGAQYSVLSTTVVFNVPDPAKCSQNTIDDELNYSMGGSFSSGTSYNVSIYDTDEYQTAGIIIRYLDENGKSPGGGYTPVFVVTDVFTSLFNDDVCTELNGFQSGAKTKIYANNPQQEAYSTSDRWKVWNTPGFKISDVKFGDVIQYSTKPGGYLGQYRVLFRPREQTSMFELYSEGDTVPKTSYRGDMYTAFGTVVAVNNKQFVYTTPAGVNKVAQFASWSNTYVVDMNEKTVEIASSSDVHTGDKVFLLINYSNLYQTVIYRW